MAGSQAFWLQCLALAPPSHKFKQGAIQAPSCMRWRLITLRITNIFQATTHTHTMSKKQHL